MRTAKTTASSGRKPGRLSSDTRDQATSSRPRRRRPSAEAPFLPILIVPGVTRLAQKQQTRTTDVSAIQVAELRLPELTPELKRCLERSSLPYGLVLMMVEF